MINSATSRWREEAENNKVEAENKEKKAFGYKALYDDLKHRADQARENI